MSENSQIVTALRSMRFDADPSEEFKALLRVRLVAVAGLGVAPVAVRDRNVGASLAALFRGWIRSTRTIATMATMSIVLAAVGFMVIAGRDALPGDALYGTKRAVEQVQLALASSPSDAAFTRLGFAEERLWEINQLLGTPEAMGPGSGPTAGAMARSARMVGLINETLDSMDRDIRHSTKTLVTQGNKQALVTLQAWSTKQRSALVKLSSRLPTGSAARAKTSTTLLTQVDTRARVRQTDVDKPCAKSRSDALGPVPCDAPVSPTAPTDAGTDPGSPAVSAGAPAVTASQPSPSPSPAPGQSGSPTGGSASSGSVVPPAGSASQTGSPPPPGADPSSGGATVTGNPTPPASSTVEPPPSDDPVGQPSEPVIVEPNPGPAPESSTEAQQPAPEPAADASAVDAPAVEDPDATSAPTTCVIDLFGVCVG